MFKLVIGLFQNFRGLLDMTHSRFFRIGFWGTSWDSFWLVLFLGVMIMVFILSDEQTAVCQYVFFCGIF